MTSNNGKEKKTPSGISGVSGSQGVQATTIYRESHGIAGSSGLTWTHQAKPVGVLGAGAVEDMGVRPTQLTVRIGVGPR